MSPTSPDRHQPTSPLWRRVTVILLMTFAALQFIRSYFFINAPYLDNARYEAGSEKMPYQARILMAWILRAADHSNAWSGVAGHLRGPLHDPSTLAVAVIGLLSILLTAVILHRWYLLVSPSRRFAALPFALFLWMVYATYLARFQEAIYFPYDLLDVSLFTLALFLCFTERYLLLALLFPIACLNRETVIVVLLPLAINSWLHLRPTRATFATTVLHPVGPRLPVREAVLALFCIAVWLAIHVHFSHLFAHNDASEFHNRIHENIGFLKNPQTWSQILSGAGFLLAVPFLWFRLMPDPRLRLYSSLIPAWVAAMFLYGLLPESRVFGEVLGFLAVYCAVQFETATLPQASR